MLYNTSDTSTATIYTYPFGYPPYQVWLVAIDNTDRLIASPPTRRTIKSVYETVNV